VAACVAFLAAHPAVGRAADEDGSHPLSQRGRCAGQPPGRPGGVGGLPYRHCRRWWRLRASAGPGAAGRFADAAASGHQLLLIITNSLVALEAPGPLGPAASLPLGACPCWLAGRSAPGWASGWPPLNDRKLRRGFAALLIGSPCLQWHGGLSTAKTASAQRAAPGFSSVLLPYP